MRIYDVRFTATAFEHLQRERDWWMAQRDSASALANDIEEAIRILRVLPGAGTLYSEAGRPDVRRFYLRTIGCHIYYTFDEESVIVRALWGARRRRGPRVE